MCSHHKYEELQEIVRGVIGASITLFTENYEIDEAEITKHFNFPKEISPDKSQVKG